MRILITNDDGVASGGLHALKAALDPLGAVTVIAPDRNRSAIGRGITIGRGISVEEVELPDGSIAYATDGTPVDCVRLSALGLIGEPPDLIVSGINLGANLGDDVTYSGTVGAALEGVMLGLPAIAVSQEYPGRPHEPSDASAYDFRAVAAFVAGLVPSVIAETFPRRSLVNVNAPNRPPEGILGTKVTTLGRRIYNDRLVFEGQEGAMRRYRIYGEVHGFQAQPGSDLVAVDAGYISVTPLHFELTDVEGMSSIERWNLDGLHLADPAPSVLP